MTTVQLTRDTLLDGSWRAALIASLGDESQLMSDAVRLAQVRAMLARGPANASVWVFGFGSLIWNPAFLHVERRTARIYGWHRRFSLWTRAGRGSPERPGLMLSLEPGGSCAGVAYRLARDSAFTELDIIWRREMITGAYRPVWTLARTPQGPEAAIAFTANPAHERHAPGLDTETVARMLASGVGSSGRASDYLFDTVAHLRALGIRDRALESIETRVRLLIAQASQSTG